LRMRRPVSADKAAKIIDEKVLVIEDWPLIAPTNPAHKNPPAHQPTKLVQYPQQTMHSVASPSTMIAGAKSVDAVQRQVKSSASVPPTTVSVPKALKEGLSAEEMRDPLNVKFYVSNEVLEHEKSSLAPGSPRYTQIEARLNFLVADVQNDRLTMEDYLNLVKSRIVQDKRLVVYLNAANRNEDALKVNKRLETMEEEVRGAEAG